MTHAAWVSVGLLWGWSLVVPAGWGSGASSCPLREIGVFPSTYGQESARRDVRGFLRFLLLASAGSSAVLQEVLLPGPLVRPCLRPLLVGPLSSA